MAGEDYKEYLASRVLTESKPVTYRLLSRSLKVHVNIAKQMLYEFYIKQNAKKPQSVHATYLLTGKQRTSELVQENKNGVNGRDGEDTVMRSSPPMSSMPETEESENEDYGTAVPETSIILAREEELEETKADFLEITSIHIYSLEPGPLQDLDILATCNNEIASQYPDENPLERWRVYGSIHNPYIKRRTTKFAPKAAVTTSKAAPKHSVASNAAAEPKAKELSKPTRQESASEDNASGRSTPQPAADSSRLKRQDSNSNAKKTKSAANIFQSFAKAKPKRKDTEQSTNSAPAVEDETMQGMSEDEGDADDEPEIKFDEEKEAANKKAREERAEKLRKMMEDADEEMADASKEGENESQDVAMDKAATPEPAGGETAVTVEGGRRRGRRKVTKKKKVKDAEGYLVTKEETAWESFSEAEPEPKKQKSAPKPSNTAKGKKAGKQGQGSIANFFKKA